MCLPNILIPKEMSSINIAAYFSLRNQHSLPISLHEVLLFPPPMSALHCHITEPAADSVTPFLCKSALQHHRGPFRNIIKNRKAWSCSIFNRD